MFTGSSSERPEWTLDTVAKALGEMGGRRRPRHQAVHLRRAQGRSRRCCVIGRIDCACGVRADTNRPAGRLERTWGTNAGRRF